ncbi:MAG: MFS transporter [Clostridiales bacterium]|jgi:MFS family permease|nr:MFS transporter [Eubacteriales bacterium]MDH7566585.1 MFS transporter [Clostridiales bacterium]
MTKNKTLIMIAVLSLSFIGMAAGAVNPAVANLTMAFSSIDPARVMMLATIPSLFSVPANLLSGYLTPRLVSYRTMLIFALALMGVSGVVPFLMNDFYLILAMRCLFGIALGLIMPLSIGIIFGLFEGPAVSNMIGLTSVLINTGGIIFQMLGGLLCVISWRHTFMVYLLVFIILGMVILWLPNPPKAAPAAADTPKFKMPLAIWGISLGFGSVMLVTIPVTLNMSMIIVNGGMGNAASAGFALMMYTVGGLVSGLVFGKIFQKAGRFTLPIAFSIACIGVVLLIVGNSLALLVVGNTLAGFGISLSMPAIQMIAGRMMPPHAAPKAFSIMNSFSGVAGFVTMIFYDGLMKALGITWIRFPFVFGLALMVVFVVIYTVVNLRPKASAAPVDAPPAA